MSETFDLFQQGRAHLEKGRPAQATVALEKAKRREPEKASIREALGIAYFRIHRYEEAASESRKMLGPGAGDHSAHYALGRCLEKQGRQAEANGHYKLASSLRPGQADYESRIRDLDESELRSPVTRRISSGEETPSTQSRTPSCRSVVIPPCTAASKISSVDAPPGLGFSPAPGSTSSRATRPL